MADLTAPEGEQPPSRVLGVTCARDGREHLVADEAMTPASAGRYPALCSHAVWAAVLACPTGPPCRQCATVRATHTTSRRLDRRSLLAHVLAWLNPTRRSGPMTGPANHGNGSRNRADEQTGTAALPMAVADYQSWGWPVTLCRDQIRLSLLHHPVAVMIPAPLAGQVTPILLARRCPPAVLTHPDAPDHHVLLAGEPFGVALPWPPGVHRITGTVLLPPTVTPRGPVTWVHPPEPDSLRLGREIDLFAALRTALTAPTAPPHAAEPSRGTHD